MSVRLSSTVDAICGKDLFPRTTLRDRGGDVHAGFVRKHVVIAPLLISFIRGALHT
jgi:hypothetical protein